LERDVQDRRARRQKQPGRAIQPHAPLVLGRRFTENVQREAMKLPPGKAGLPRHHVHIPGPVCRIQSPAQSPRCFRISNYTSLLHFLFSTSPFYFLLSSSS
jgi:hypothetical protein